MVKLFFHNVYRFPFNLRPPANEFHFLSFDSSMGQICATEATARIGQLMLEDLVTMHMEFRQFYGAEESNFPQWMRWQDVARLPSALKEIVSGKDGGKLGGWMPLYR